MANEYEDIIESSDNNPWDVLCHSFTRAFPNLAPSPKDKGFYLRLFKNYSLREPLIHIDRDGGLITHVDGFDKKIREVVGELGEHYPCMNLFELRRVYEINYPESKVNNRNNEQMSGVDFDDVEEGIETGFSIRWY